MGHKSNIDLYQAIPIYIHITDVVIFYQETSALA